LSAHEQDDDITSWFPAGPKLFNAFTRCCNTVPLPAALCRVTRHHRWAVAAAVAEDRFLLRHSLVSCVDPLVGTTWHLADEAVAYGVIFVSENDNGNENDWLFVRENYAIEVGLYSNDFANDKQKECFRTE